MIAAVTECAGAYHNRDVSPVDTMLEGVLDGIVVLATGFGVPVEIERGPDGGAEIRVSGRVIHVVPDAMSGGMLVEVPTGAGCVARSMSSRDKTALTRQVWRRIQQAMVARP